MRWVAYGCVREVGGGRLGQDGGGGEVQGRGRVRAPGDPCRDGKGQLLRALPSLSCSLGPHCGWHLHLGAFGNSDSSRAQQGLRWPGLVVIHTPKRADFHGKPSRFWRHPCSQGLCPLPRPHSKRMADPGLEPRPSGPIAHTLTLGSASSFCKGPGGHYFLRLRYNLHTIQGWAKGRLHSTTSGGSGANPRGSLCGSLKFGFTDFQRL